jgi:tetratricopeptide (TPR) repeat protein
VEKAQADVEQALAEDPSDLDVQLAAAEVAIQRHDTAAARHHLAAIDPARRDDLKVRITEGVLDLIEQRPDDAIAHWRAGLVRAGGNDADLTWRLAHVLLETGRTAEAEPLIAQYHRLLGGESPPPRYLYLQGLLLLRTNRLAEAVAALEAIRYKIDKPLEPHVYYALGQAYEATRDSAKALEAFRQAAEQSQDWSAPWAAVARIQLPTRPAEALATLQRGLALNRNDPRLMAAVAGVLWREQIRLPKAKRSWGEVEQLIAKAKAANPGSPDVALIESDYYEATDRPDDALGLLQTATGLNPKSTDLWLARANALARRGHLAQALDVLDQAVAAAGPQAGLFVTRASLLIVKGQVGDAQKTLTDALAHVPAEQKPLLWKTLGEFHQGRGDATAARAAIDQWARLQPDNPEPRMAAVELAIAGGDDDAVARAVAAVRGIGGPKSYYWRLARVQELVRDRPSEAAKPDPARDARRLDEAETLIKEIQTNDPQLPLGYLLEGGLCEKRKQVERAIGAYEAALKRNAGSLALNPLVALLVREGRDADLARLRDTLADVPGDVNLDRLAAVQALKQGNKTRAEQLAALAARGDAQGLDARVWQAEVLQALGKPEAAAAALKLQISQDPSRPTPWIQLLMLQVNQHQTEAAAATIEQIRGHVHPEYPELLWAQCYRAVGDIAKAGECYQQALQRWPSDANVLASAISFYEQTGRRAAAEEALRALLRRDPANAWAARKLAAGLAGRSANRAAWDEALSLIGPERRPDDVPEDLLARANVYAQSGQPADRRKAIAILEGLLAEMPNLAAVHEQAARLLYAAGELSAAREHAAKAAAGRPTPDAILFYAGVLLALKDVDAAEAELSRLAAADADGLRTTELKARLLDARGQGGEAAKLLERAFDGRSTGPDGLEIGERMVRLLLSLHQAEAAARVARKLAPLGPKGKCLLAEQLAALGKADEAAPLLDAAATADDPAAACTTALGLATRPAADPRWLALADRYLDKLPPGSPDRLDKTALVRHLQNRYADELDAYRAMLRASPANFLFLNNMAWTLSEHLDRPKEALARADEAIKRAGALPYILDTRGVILTRLDRIDDALADLEAAARDLPTGPVYFHLARAYQKKGKPDDARKYRDLAKKAGLTRDQLQGAERAEWDAVINTP